MTRDFAGGAAAGLVGAIYLVFAYQLRTSALDDTLGPGGMPRIYGWLMVGLAVALCLQTWAKGARRDAADGEWHGQGRKILWAAGLLALGVGYLLVVETLGYLIAIALLLCAAAAYQGAPRNGRLAVVGIGGALVLWSLFAHVLGVAMPHGLLAAVGL